MVMKCVCLQAAESLPTRSPDQCTCREWDGIQELDQEGGLHGDTADREQWLCIPVEGYHNFIVGGLDTIDAKSVLGGGQHSRRMSP